MDQRRWDDAVAVLAEAVAVAPASAARYWLAQARFQQARHAPPTASLDTVERWRQVLVDLLDARRVSATRVEVDTTLLAHEIETARVHLRAALAELEPSAGPPLPLLAALRDLLE